MAYTISVCDTHRIPYPNATVKAYKLGSAMQTTDQIKFKHGKNGPEIGFEIKTNARGYFCDSNGDLYTNGVFVTEDAIIKVTMADGTSTTWEAATGADTAINDGILYGTKNKDTDELEPKWSANSPNPYTLDYDHLLHKPRMNEWMEVEQVVTMEQANDSVNVDKYCKTMTISCKNDVAPSRLSDGTNAQWTQVGGVWTPSDSSKPNGEWCITLRADADRVAQVICVRNWTPWRLAIKNVEGQIIAVLDPTSSDKGEFVTLYGTTEPALPYHGTVNTEKLDSVHQIVFGAGVLNNSASNPVLIDDYTPDTVLVRFDVTYGYSGYPTELYMKSGVTKSRVVRLWLQNFKTDKGLSVYDAGNANSFVGIIANFTVVELIVSPSGLVKLSEYIKVHGTTLILDGSQNQVLPPDATYIAGSTDSNYYIATASDTTTDKMIYGLITNTSTTAKTLRLDIGGTEVTFGLLPNSLNSFVIHKMGTQFCVIKPTSGAVGNKYLQLSANGSDDPDYGFKVTKTVATQDTINVNIPYMMQMHGQTWDSFGDGDERSYLVFDISSLVAVNQSIVLRFKIDAYTVSGNSDYDSAVIKFGTVDNASGEIPLSERDSADVLCICRKNIIATIYRTAAGYTVTSYGVEDTQE